MLLHHCGGAELSTTGLIVDLTGGSGHLFLLHVVGGVLLLARSVLFKNGFLHGFILTLFASVRDCLCGVCSACRVGIKLLIRCNVCAQTSSISARGVFKLTQTRIADLFAWVKLLLFLWLMHLCFLCIQIAFVLLDLLAYIRIALHVLYIFVFSGGLSS